MILLWEYNTCLLLLGAEPNSKSVALDNTSDVQPKMGGRIAVPHPFPLWSLSLL